MKNKIIALAAVGVISIGGLSMLSGNEDKNTIPESQAQLPAGTSEMKQEKLAVVGTVKEITEKDGDRLIRVVGEQSDEAAYEDILVHVHASTNVEKENQEKIGEITDIQVGQNVKVYYDGSEDEYNPGQISGLRTIILK